ncbi:MULTISPECIES: heme lyase CcmF/NrfE family subunit [Acidobacterium]|uniref:Cytochrome c-type biogenesis protein CcmF n=1 Tax=Acidobacterium capsulatum (strain ATCC 51196 / DSM 11244 / BCRC 80197 / JCM 7670 / NBRC 15755 / NCIMB 13165 / 161) TaxID=240015 RepID=C1F387_ACIC5|nr:MULTISPECIES: heme lyase CcmF/NrfE family subunit [Acidobacterium]ACO31387.1 cytochrome c-type biogenesis protein CcmF [Acidobacterium capsulatum ATCC 51196]HCT60629.1 heme lyase CcmF/NrfE family subunit [Acidobacterium sp.]
MPTFGSFALLLALALSAYNLLAGGIALRQLATGRRGRISPEKLAETARRAGIASFVAVSCAAFALVWAAFTNDFSVSYILHHSNRALAAPYKFAALWSGQEGSLLLWAWLLAGYGFVVRLRHKVDVKLSAYASTILAAVQVFFLMVVNFAAPPFALVQGAVPADGFGLNPLLQYPEMVIHPPMLYLGYVGFSVPFAFALGALMMRYPGEKWIHITRRWTMVTWLFLTCGIFLGMHWAYEVLGWGGYWGWDPVENASLMPWIAGTAFLHSVMMQEKRGMMKSWNVWLIFSTFMLSILGTLLTRSGLVSSVHAFAQSSIGTWFWVFLVIVMAVCLFTYILQRDHLKSDHKLEALVSRESSFLFNNVVLLAACFTVLWGTLFPVLSEFVQGNKVTVSAPFYDRVAVPIGLFLLFLTGIGPLLAWRSTSLRSIRKNFIVPAAVGAAFGVAVMFVGVHPWVIFQGDTGPFYSWVTFVLAAAVTTAIASEFFRGARVIQRHTGKNLFAAVVQLTRRNTRRYGGYLVHFGVVVIFIGFAGSAFNQSKEAELNFKQSMTVGPYRLQCLDYSEDTNPNYDTEYALLNVYRDGKFITQLDPSKRFYEASQQVSTIVANRSTPLWDLYVIYAGKDDQTGQPIIRAFLNPLVMWIWIGVIIVALGTLLALVPNSQPASAVERGSRQSERELAPARKAGV